MAARSTPDSTKPISSATPAKSQAGCLILFFAVFLAVGLATTYLMLVRPVWGILQATSWTPTPCTVISSTVQEHPSSDGSTYSINIRYRYEINGSTFESDRYDFDTGSSSGRDGKQRVVNQYPPGSSSTCYVNPANPNQAVLNRGFHAGYLLGLFPLIFVAVGGGGIFFAARSYLRSKRPAPPLPISTPAGPPGGDPFAAVFRLSGMGKVAARVAAAASGTGLPAPLSVNAQGRVDLRTASSPLGRFLGATFACAFWNGIVSVFLYQAYKGWSVGRPDWCITLFMVPFVVVGLILIGSVPYFFMGLFSPRARLSLPAGAASPGETIEVDYAFVGRVGLLRSWKLVLEGREEATYVRGTDRTTDKNVFLTRELYVSEGGLLEPEGRVPLTLPAEVMHSFEAPRNKVIWHLRIEGDVAYLPDIKDEYRIVVLPPDAAADQSPPPPPGLAPAPEAT